MANHFIKEGNFYVSAIGGNDSNAGTQDAPFKTISAGITAAEAAGTGYGQTVVIGTGIYNERIVANTTTDHLVIQGDGNVIIDGTDIVTSITYQPFKYHFKDLTIINAVNIHDGSVTYTGNWTRCVFKNCPDFYFSNYNSNGLGSRNIYTDCVFIDCETTNASGKYLRYFQYNNCSFFNSSWHSSMSGARNTNDLQNFWKNCLFSVPPESYPIAQYYVNNYGAIVENCMFSSQSKAYLGNVGFDGTLTEENINTVAVGGIVGSFVKPYNFNNNITSSGDYNFLDKSMPYNNVTKELYQSSGVVRALSSLGGFAPRTAYGEQNLASNPLHTAGGATWSNIVTGSLGGFQIGDDSIPSGSITTAIIDQGSVKSIESIDAGFSTTALNIAAASTFPSGAFNYNPTRYQYEMKHGNSPSLSGKNFEIFEWNQTPFVNSNGTGSGDQLFDTGSFTQVAARYLQLRITLRTDMGG